MDSKLCRTCGLDKPLDEFPPPKGAGLRNRKASCLVCRRAMMSACYEAARAIGVTVTEKQCRVCHETKPASEFYRHPSKQGGIDNICAVCQRVDMKERHRRAREVRPKDSVCRDGTKRCRVCGEERPRSEFPWSPQSTDGLESWCLACRRAHSESRYREPNERPDEVERCRGCNQSFPATLEFFHRTLLSPTGLSKRCMACENKARRDRHAEIRVEVLMHYGQGEPLCVCCGEERLEFLVIDHINGGGGAERRALRKSGRSYFQWIKNQGYPGNLRILCQNCNASRGAWGYCPHEREAVAPSLTG